jgi:hypothetical protein
MRYHFHPSDKSASAMFYRAHDQIADRNRTFFAIQNGPNPLSSDEIRRLAAKHPERWGAFADWNRGLTKFSTRERAEEHHKIVQDAFSRFCRWEMVTRVVEVEGNILDQSRQ